MGSGLRLCDSNRWKYGLTERDAATGLDDTSWRKLESFSGRWTSPDPYLGSMSTTNSQSFNRYSYVMNEPVSLIDPDGLSCGYVRHVFTVQDGVNPDGVTIDYVWECHPDPIIITILGGDSGGGLGGNPMIPGGRTPVGPQQPAPKNPTKSYAARVAACCARCANAGRLDNVIRDAGNALGHPGIGNIVAGLTIVGSAAALGNEALNLTSLGAKPRSGLGGVGYSSAGDPTTCQHTLAGQAGRDAKIPMLGRIGRGVGRASEYVSLGLLAFEAGYSQSQSQLCLAGCSANPDQF